MKRRPAAITVIAWFHIVTSLFGLICIIYAATSYGSHLAEYLTASPISLPFQLAAFTSTIGFLACGIGMLKGHNWARLLYVGSSILSFGVTFITPHKTNLIPAILLFLIICFFLYRPAANQFFQGKG